MQKEALSGLRVLDLTRLLPGPYCSMMLADLGAEVIKVEEVGRGDYIRQSPPIRKKESALYLSLNRNKKSLTLNLKMPRAREIFCDLVRTADVVLEGFRPGVMDKLELGYKDLQRFNPKIIYCSISGYGQDGPYAHRAGHDLNYLSIAGIMSITGTKDGRPVIPGVQIADIGGGAMLAAFCILAAVVSRSKTGKGQYIDVSMMDGAFSWLSLHAGKYFADGMIPSPSGELLNGKYACYNIYRTKDGKYMSLGALEQQFWSAFCEAINRKDLVDDQYADGKKGEDLIAEIASIFLLRSRQQWVEVLKDTDCCCEPVNSFDEAFSHPQVIHRNLIVHMDHPLEGRIPQINFPGKYSETPARMKTSAPRLGEHTREILTEIGISKEEMDLLAKENII